MNISKKDKILVAGANGMVGSAIKRLLKERGYGSQNNGRIFTPSKRELDFTSFQNVEIWFKENKPNIVIIAAAKVGGIFANNENPYEFLLENLQIQINLIEISRVNNVKRLLFLGSSCIYPKSTQQPIKENQLLTGSLEITNEAYALAKIAGLKLCQYARFQKKFDAISLMPSNLYGPGDNYHINNSHVLPALIRKFYEAKINSLNEVECWGDGSPLREFLYVDDLASACIFVLEKWNPAFNRDNTSSQQNNRLTWLNIGTKEEISIKNLAIKISQIIGFKGNIIWNKSKPNGTLRKKLDCSEIYKLGWEPSISITEGIKFTIDDFKKKYHLNKLREN